jgi:hypothetical protein
VNEKLRRDAANKLIAAASAYIRQADAAPNQHEGWKGSGRCKICRRRSYCRKVCTAAQRRIRALESGTLAATILSGLEGTP